MNLLFLTIGDFKSISQRGIYPDLLREFSQAGHEVSVICSRERRSGSPTELVKEEGASLLHVRVGNITKTNIIEKGVSTILIGYQYKRAIRKYFHKKHFDLILYATPPITLAAAIHSLKKKHNAQTYLMLKDIFPQNAVDIGMMTTTGPKGLLYKYFRKKERKLYAISDRIGCMSQANKEYLLKHNPDIPAEKAELCPNCMDVQDIVLSAEKRRTIRRTLGISDDIKVFVYGGNLGRPQGISFVINCLKTQVNKKDVFFLIIGNGTEYKKIDDYFRQNKPHNMKLLQYLPKEDFDILLAACDVGLVFLDYSFSIPNFPSRILSYMQAQIPILACTDPCTDIGKVITEGGFGWWCESNDVNKFVSCIDSIKVQDTSNMGIRGLDYLRNHYTARQGYEIIMGKTEQ